MMKKMAIAQARKELNQLSDLFNAEPEDSALAITRRGQPVLALMPWGLYEGIAETLEVLGDQTLSEALREGIRQIKAGDGETWQAS